MREHQRGAVGEMCPAQGGRRRLGRMGRGGKQGGTGCPGGRGRGWLRGTGSLSTVVDPDVEGEEPGGRKDRLERSRATGLQPERNLPCGFFHRWSPSTKRPVRVITFRRKLISMA